MWAPLPSALGPRRFLITRAGCPDKVASTPPDWLAVNVSKSLEPLSARHLLSGLVVPRRDTERYPIRAALRRIENRVDLEIWCFGRVIA
ncbi:hypothetical protein FDECE_15199 [Fusarium decemcellulare]|nr:hypothetical protein FDECE_15199 [Fusarium decemcellulare]